MNRADWPLLVIAAAGADGLEPVHLQKTLFLINRQADELEINEVYEFKPYDYGPFSVDIYRDVDQLVDDGMVAIGYQDRVRRYRLTEAGRARADQLREHLSPPQRDFTERVVGWASTLTFRQLVQAIYQEFPEYRANSIFRA